MSRLARSCYAVVIAGLTVFLGVALGIVCLIVYEAGCR